MSESLTNAIAPKANLGYLFRLAYQRFRAALDDALRRRCAEAFRRVADALAHLS